MFLVGDGVVQSQGLFLACAKVSARFLPLLDDGPVGRQFQVGGSSHVERGFEVGEGDELTQVVRPALLGELSLGEPVGGPHQVGDDTRLQATFDGIPRQVVGARPSAGSKEDLRVTKPIPGKPL
jgi:hypothetical protein